MAEESQTPETKHEVTLLLQRVRVGDAGAANDLMPLIYRQLHMAAARYMRRERANHTLQPTVLVHEAFLQLAATGEVDWQNRAHFLALASRAMRRVLIDHARSAKAEKRPGGHQQVELEAGMLVVEQPVDLLAIHEVLDRLAEQHERQASIVEMRFFGGLDFEEIAEVLGISVSTAKRDWTVARAWLYREMTAV